MPRERDKYRKFESGYDKQKKKEKRENFLKTQQGAFEKFLKHDEPEKDVSKQDHININSIDNNKPSTSKNTDFFDDMTVNSINILDDSDSDQSDETKTTPSDNYSNVNILTEEIDFNLNDPGLWPVTLSTSKLDEIVLKGPLQVVNFRFPLDSDNRHFSVQFYKRILPNGEEMSRRWLVYSKSTNKAFCFCCKLFGNETGTKLAGEGFCNWRNISSRLKNHEQSQGHAVSVQKWIECELRLSKALTIDEEHRSLMRKEKEHWREVLKRIFQAIKYLAEHNIAFRGSNSKLYEPNNGNFLGLIEMIATFDPIMQEHVRRIKSSEIHDHYLGPRIQNELIEILSFKVTEKNIMDIKAAKYFSVLLDCTPDLSHNEQLSIVIRFVKVTDVENVTIEEHFIQFFDIKSTTGRGITEVLLDELDKMGLQIKDCRGQGYDNGSNMKGIHSGVQARILELNPRAFYMPCASHSLNLLICDAAKSSPQAMTFFGVIQRIYITFSASTKRWDILIKHVTSFTVKRSCDTRWESKLESIKALRYQIKEVHDALIEVVETSEDPKAKSEARSLLNEISSYEFLLALAIWYDVLFAVNSVSKNLQAENMHLGTASQLLNGLVKFFEKFRNEGFTGAILVARELSEALGAEPKFREARQRKRKRLFEYEGKDEPVSVVSYSAEESFKIEYFYFIVDVAATSLTRRFEQMTNYNSMFGFLYTIEELKKIEEDKLKTKCKNLEDTLSFDEERDICGEELFTELKVLRELLPSEVQTAAGVLRFMNKMQNPFPNAFVAYRILLTIPVTVASAERSFSRLKLIKTYLRTSMSQERLTSLATLSIEADVTSKVSFEEVIDKFAGLKARKCNFVFV